jgi:hypothetical protein
LFVHLSARFGLSCPGLEFEARRSHLPASAIPFEFIGLLCLNDSCFGKREDKIRKISQHNFVSLGDRRLYLSLAKRAFVANVMGRVNFLRVDCLKACSQIGDLPNPCPC